MNQQDEIARLTRELAEMRHQRDSIGDLSNRILVERDALTRELAEAHAEIERLTDQRNAQQMKAYARRDECETLRSQLEQKDREAAAMREALERARCLSREDVPLNIATIDAALSTSVGKGFVRREVLEQCVETIRAFCNAVTTIEFFFAVGGKPTPGLAEAGALSKQALTAAQAELAK